MKLQSRETGKPRFKVQVTKMRWNIKTKKDEVLEIAVKVMRTEKESVSAREVLNQLVG